MKNHFIPCFYTKRWVGEDKRLAKFSRPRHSIEARRRYPSEVGFETDLYTIPGVDAAVKDLLETRFFRRIDQDASNVLDKMDASNAVNLSDKERFVWSTFLVSLRQRNPAKVAELGKQVQANIGAAIDELRDEFLHRDREGGIEAFEQQVQTAIEAKWFERVEKVQLQNAILLPKTIDALMKFYWYVVTFDRYNYDLMSSDRPLIMTNGIATEFGHVALPIGPKRMFIACRNREIALQIQYGKNLASTVNELIVRQAHTEVYARNFDQQSFVDRRFTPAASP